MRVTKLPVAPTFIVFRVDSYSNFGRMAPEPRIVGLQALRLPGGKVLIEKDGSWAEHKAADLNGHYITRASALREARRIIAGYSRRAEAALRESAKKARAA